MKGHFRKLDGTGVRGQLTYWYQQAVNNASLDLATGFSFADEDVTQYYALITNNVATEADGSYQLDFVPAPIGDYIGPFVLQGGSQGAQPSRKPRYWARRDDPDGPRPGRQRVRGRVRRGRIGPTHCWRPGDGHSGATEQRFHTGTGGGSFSVGAITDVVGHYHLDGLKTGIFSLQVLKGELGAVSGGQIATDGQVVSLNVLLQGKVAPSRPVSWIRRGTSGQINRCVWESLPALCEVPLRPAHSSFPPKRNGA